MSFSKTDVSLHIHRARKQMVKAHGHADTWTEAMEHTVESIKALGIQHYGRAGENLPERILDSQAEAMASLTYTYGEMVYETTDEELTFYDDSQRDKFDDHLDAAHEAAMTALRLVEGER